MSMSAAKLNMNYSMKLRKNSESTLDKALLEITSLSVSVHCKFAEEFSITNADFYTWYCGRTCLLVLQVFLHAENQDRENIKSEAVHLYLFD